MKKRVNTAFWVEKEKRWCIAVQKNGTRKRFYSSTPGRTGQREANAKADAWLDDSIRDGKKKVAALYAQWVEELKLTCGTSYVEQCKKYGDYYILPVCGDIRIDELTEGDLQKAINMSFKKRCLKKERQRRSSDKPLSRKTLMTIRSTEISFLKWCRRNRYSTMFPELSIPKNARMGKKKILQPTALKVLFDVDTRLYYGKLVFDEYIYAYRFAVATSGLWGCRSKMRSMAASSGRLNVCPMEMPPICRRRNSAAAERSSAAGMEGQNDDFVIGCRKSTVSGGIPGAAPAVLPSQAHKKAC